ncbi:MAG: hypothetical protein ACR2HC_04270, partial [Thermoleophilaceae bacterium]
MSPVRFELREQVRAAPGLEPVLATLEGLPPAYLVGGMVRDLLRGEAALDLDVAIEGDGVTAAQEIARRLGGTVVRHERFGTATVTAERIVLDVASTRTEWYPEPGTLPRVRPAPLPADLSRRDFTVNAMAIALSGDQLGRLHDPLHGAADIDAKLIRVLHDGSFLDDPTRLIRAIRYATRLDYELELETERLALTAIEGGAPVTVSGPRVREELLRLLAESDAAGAVNRLHGLGLDRALHPELHADADLVASAELGALETGADRALAGLAALVTADSLSLAVWLDRLQVTRAERDRVVGAARAAPEIAAALALRDRRPSELAALLRGESPETLALTLAMGAPAPPILDWIHRLRHVHLEITGDDLRAAGVAESRALSHALATTLDHQPNSELADRHNKLHHNLPTTGA